MNKWICAFLCFACLVIGFSRGEYYAQTGERHRAEIQSALWEGWHQGYNDARDKDERDLPYMEEKDCPERQKKGHQQ